MKIGNKVKVKQQNSHWSNVTGVIISCGYDVVWIKVDKLPNAYQNLPSSLAFPFHISELTIT